MKNEISEYEQKAIDFLKLTNAEFKVEFLRNGKYFYNDKYERDIYKITLTRGNRIYSFEFGQSIANSGNWFVKDKNPKFTKSFDDKSRATNWAEKIGNSFNVIKNPNKKEPNSYDVLACLTKYDPGTFENFCDEFGYGTDSKNAEKIYFSVKEEYLNITRLFSDAEIELLQEIN